MVRERAIDTYRGRPIFIMGSARSGTTLLGLMLQAHSSIAVPPETRLLLPTYFDREQFGDLNVQENRVRLAEAITGNKNSMFGDLGLDKDEIAGRIVSEAGTVGAAIGIVFRSYADRFDKRRWGDKRPNYHSYIWVVQRMFPDAQFVNIVRDGRDCVASMKSHPIWQDKPYWRVQTWVEAIDNTRQAKAELPEDTFFELQYENLVADPEKQLTALCDFLGEPFEEAMLNPQEVAGDVVPTRKTWHARTHQEVSSDTVGKFTDRLDPWELSLCEHVMADHLRYYGYELTGAPAPDKEHLQKYAKVDEKRRGKVSQQWRKDLTTIDLQPVADLRPLHTEQQRLLALESRVATLMDQREMLQAQLDRLQNSRTWRMAQRFRKIRRVLTGGRSK